MKNVLLLMVLLLALGVGAPLAGTLAVSPAFDGTLWTYTYEIGNPAGSGFEVDYFELTGLAENVIAAGWPENWEFAWSMGGIAAWETPIWSSSSDPVREGETLGGFILQSPAAPGPVNFFMQGLTGFSAGIVEGPVVPVPEAGTMALLGVGLALLGWTRRRR